MTVPGSAAGPGPSEGGAGGGAPAGPPYGSPYGPGSPSGAPYGAAPPPSGAPYVPGSPGGAPYLPGPSGGAPYGAAPPPSGSPYVPGPPPSGSPYAPDTDAPPGAGEPPAYHRQVRHRGGAWWRIPLVVLLGAVALVGGTVVTVLLTVLGARLFGFDDFSFSLEDGINPAELLATNLGLALLIPLASLLYWPLYGRRPRWLSSLTPGLRWRWLWVASGIAAVVWSPLLVLGTVGVLSTRDGPVDQQVVAMLLVVVFTTPLQAAGEEYLFRGVLLQALGATRLSTWLCSGISAALFAAAHLQFDPALLTSRFVLGAVLAWLTIRTGGLEAGIAIHAANNLAVLIPSAFLEDIEESLDPSGGSWIPVVVSAVLLAIAVPWMLAVHKRRIRRAPPPWP